MLHCFLAFGDSKKQKLQNLRFLKCFGMQDGSVMQKDCLYLFGLPKNSVQINLVSDRSKKVFVCKTTL